jgi:hypothetical protein
MEEEKCQRCQEVVGTPELHPCPYDEEINGNPEPVCNCCDDCTQDCMWDI